MRNFVILVILGFVGWWGYSNWWETAQGSGGNATTTDGATSGVNAGASTGVRGEGQIVANPVRRSPGNEAEDEARRLIQALRARDYSGIEVDAGLQSRLLGNSAALYSLEVGLALGRPDGPSADLARTADALIATSGVDSVADAPALLCSGMLILVGEKRPESALEALGTKNGFLMTRNARTSEKALQVYLDAMAGQDEEDAGLLLSSLVTRMTRGRDVWRGSKFQALRTAVAALYGVLEKVILNPNGVWRSSYVVIGKRDTLSKIANRFERNTGVPVAPGLIQLVNGIPNADRIGLGDRLRIPSERMEVVVSKGSFTMRVYLGDLLIRIYQVGIGKKDSETPLGTYEVIEKQLDPVWYSPSGGVIPAKDPRNLLGHYFIKLKHPTHKGFGIHGTPKPQTVGTHSSLGCIRVRDEDMDQLFSIIPRKTRVKVED